MIDVPGVLLNSLWILALAMLLTLLSWSSWQARREGVRFRNVWARAHIQRLLAVSLALFCGSLAALSERVWERGLWALLTAAWLVQLALPWVTRRRRARDDVSHE
ncbi:MAG: hypothetical protein GYA30_14060 [Chloroflexi bacterium]|nr:hypothetical protein [Chloroflexota bacterium]HOV49560.1 hypothetical protein [Anaerolineae bacterium]